MQDFTNNAGSTLATGINDTDTSITLASASSFPTPAGGRVFYATLIGLNSNGQENAWEIVKCTAKASNTLTVVRAQEGTTAASWGVGIRLELRETAGFAQSVDNHLGAGGTAHANAVAAGAAGFMTGTDKTKLDGIAAGAEVNVNADWTAGSGDAQILNKPTLGTAAAAATGDFATSGHNHTGVYDAAGAAASAITTANAYSDGLVVGAWDDRGSWSAVATTYPTTGGRGVGGLPVKGDLWTISAAGTLAGGVVVNIGDVLRAIVDTPGQTSTNWAVVENNIGYVPENAANKVTSVSGASTDTQYPSAKLTYDQLAGKQATMTAASQAEMEAGTETALRTMTPARVKQAITALAPLTPEIVTPTNTSPADAATGQGETPTLTGSTFYSNYGATHSNIQVQVSTSSSFASPLYSSGDQAGSTSFVLPAGQLSVSTTYYWRMRYKNSRGTYSDWSTATTFQTKASFNDVIATPTATPANYGDAFEGGFYAGLFWNELVQSSTSMAIGTGAGKAFTVPNMATTPIAYIGQTLEVRSRANPTNKLICTVTGAVGTTLTLNCSSVGGSGTFTDWSIMSRYRSINAPKSTESSSLTYKSTNDAAPAACGTLTEGLKATLAMVAAGDATVYPAAWYCHNLTTGGKTDWYLGARDQNELNWRNEKPVTDANYTTADRPTAATPNYANLGSYGDTAATHGLNNNSSPTGAAYTSGSPAQTSVSAYQTGGAEAFTYGSSYYWSSSEYSATSAWRQYWLSSSPGYQVGNSKSNTVCVRAVRRSII